MFTGIVEGTGAVHSIRRSGRSSRLAINGGRVTSKLSVGDSVAVSGVCLTVVAKRRSVIQVQAVEETLKKTNLGELKVGQHVNLELPLRASDRMGGHIVLGHVDVVGKIAAIRSLKKSWNFRFKIPRRFWRYIVPTGSIAIDGVSLTVAKLNGAFIEASIIPHTMERTIFRYRRAGDTVNLEFDVIGKYVESLLTKK